jgi:hypothetical protein
LVEAFVKGLKSAFESQVNQSHYQGKYQRSNQYQACATIEFAQLGPGYMLGYFFVRFFGKFYQLVIGQKGHGSKGLDSCYSTIEGVAP